MRERTVAAEAEGAVLFEALLHNRPGRISVRVDPECEQASAVVWTNDLDGIAADAVRTATLEWNPDDRRLTVDVTGPDDDRWGGWRVDIDAVVPPGSSLDAHTDAAYVETVGEIPLRDAAVVTASGGVKVDADEVYAETVSGPINVGYAIEAVVRSKGEVAPGGEEHVSIRAAEKASVQVGGDGSVWIGQVTRSVDVTTERGDVVINQLSHDSAGHSEVRSKEGQLTATVMGGRDHTFSSSTGSVNVTLGETAPLDGKVKISAAFGPVKPTASAEFLRAHQLPGGHGAATTAGAEAGSGTAASGAGTAATSFAPPTAPRGAIER